MNALIALFVRSVRQTTRSGGTYLLRAVLAGGVLLALIGAHIGSLYLGAPGLKFFQIVFFLNYFYLGLAGCGFFATAVTEEKEEGTLGLLRMTNLNALSILLGKSTGRLCAVLLLIAVQIPFLMLGVTMGGISVHQILAAYCLLGLFALSAANFALLCSVYCRRVWSASVLTLLAFIGVGFILPMLYQPLIDGAVAKGWISDAPAQYERIERVGSWLRDVSPFGHLGQITSGSFWEAHLGENVITHLSFAMIFFVAAWCLFDRRCHDASETAATVAAGTARGFFIRMRRRRRPWHRAIAWKDFHFQYGGWRVVWLRALAYSVIATLLVIFASKMMKVTRQGVAQALFFSGTWVLSIELAIFAALIWSREHWGHTLGSIVSLPRSLASIFGEKLWALLPALLPSLALLATAVAVGGQKWAMQLVSSLLSNGSVAPLMFAFAPMGIWGILWKLLETIWYLHLVAYFSLRMRWAALPVAYGIASAISTGGYILASLVVMISQGGVGIRGSGFNILNPFGVHAAIMAVLYGVAAFFLFRMTRQLILARAGES